MKVLIVLPGFIPSTIIGVLRPLAALEGLAEINLRVRLYNINFSLMRDIEWCDVAVFCRNCEVRDLKALYELRRLGKKIVYEIDDNFEEISLNTDIGIYHRAFHRLHVLRRFFELSDVSRLYSERMKQCAIKHGANVQFIRSYFDQSLVEGLSRRASDGVIRIAYPTGRIDDKELEETIFSAVRLVIEKYAGKVEFHLWRKQIPKQLSGVNGVVINKAVKGYDKFICSFFKMGFDIGLAPGVDTPFFRSKTNNKYREFGGCGVAGVYSNFPPYADSVIHERSGLLAGSTKEEWVSAIERLIVDGDLREKIVNNSADDVRANYNFDGAVESWRECFSLLSKSSFDKPVWLPESKKFPIFSFVDLTSKSKIGRRYDHLVHGFHGIPGAVLERFHGAGDYFRSSFKRISCASVFLIDGEGELDVLAQLIAVSTSAIVDLSCYRGDVDGAIKYLRGSVSVTPMSFLVAVNQAKNSVFADGQVDCASVVDGRGSSSLIHDFSLSGYPAAYLNLLERHIQYAPEDKPSRFFARPKAKVRRIADTYQLVKSRFDTLTTLIKWRIGLRQF